jgi:vitamin B12 transporter
MYVKKISLICLILLSGIVYGQKTMTDSTYLIKEVVVRSNQLQDFAVGSSIQKMDSLSKYVFYSSSFADLLTSRSQVLIKSYGPGGVSNASIRGGAAAHTAVVWNGVNIQSPMDGGVDFAILPIALFDDITIQYGGSGTLYGSGAVSGIIHLDNYDLFNADNKISLNAAYGSFKQEGYNLSLKLGNQNIANSFRFYTNYADNDFEFKNTNGAKVKQSNAGLEQNAIMNKTQLKTGER